MIPIREGDYVMSDTANLSGFVIGRATSNGIPMLSIRTAEGAVAYLAEARVLRESRPMLRLASVNGVQL